MSVDADGGPDDRLTPVLRPVRAGNGFEEALEQILRVVRLGLVPGGGRLPAERELAERLGISRVTLREVLKVLEDQGLVESRRGRYGGTFVLPRAQDAVGEEELRRRIAEADIEDVLRFREVWRWGRRVCARRTASRTSRHSGCARLWRPPRRLRWRTTGAWTRCCTSRWRNCAARPR